MAAPLPSSSPAGQVAPAGSRQVIDQAAARYGIPAGILWGVFGSESGYGRAYAGGGNTYGFFGLVSPGLWHPGMSFAEDADTAAKLLRTLYGEHGNDWNAALLAYSGNSYGIDHVKAMAGGQPTAIAGGVGPALSTSSGSASSSSSSGPGTWTKLLLDVVMVGFGMAAVYRGGRRMLAGGGN